MGEPLIVNISTAVAANGVWAGRDLPQCRVHCPHPSAKAGGSGEGACSVTGVPSRRGLTPRGSLEGCRPWGRTESDTTEGTEVQQQDATAVSVIQHGPMVRTLHFHCREHGFDPWQGN